MFKIISFILTVLFLILGVSLGVLNPHTVKIDLFWFQYDSALSIIMAAVFIVGMLVGSAVMLMQITRLKWRLTQKQRENKKQADQIVQLRKAQSGSASTLEKNRSLLINNK